MSGNGGLRNKNGLAVTGSPKQIDGGVGDVAEVWDVKRGWIAKWHINRSPATQHGSGTFSHLDLRDATKPADAIPPVSNISGWLTFLPRNVFDFIVSRPEELKRATKYGIKQREIGDTIFQNTSQDIRTQGGLAFDSLEIFVHLPKTYVIEGEDRRKICSSNAQITFQAGHSGAAQIWSLAAMSLTNIIPNPLTRLPFKNNMIQSVSAPFIVSHEADTSPGGKYSCGTEKTSSIYSKQLYTRSLSRA
ncbi:hypothetical protein F5051DRAFT_469182 [Lentinula edodes]|nr:hypothetical protein F5051DRAFT_469182 [Lentinula edodes]